MTRINVGILPAELCDQHLIAEYRELPRMAAFSRKSHEYDMPFTLCTGHMKSCVKYGGYLAVRHIGIVIEMEARGFKPSFPAVPLREFVYPHYPSLGWILAATPIVKARIVERLRTMKRLPTWTNRPRPSWTNP